MSRKECAAACAASLAGILLALARPPEMFVVNRSISMPRGLYRIDKALPAPGDCVIIDTVNTAQTGIQAPQRLLKRLAYSDCEPYSIDAAELRIAGNAYQKYHRDIGLVAPSSRLLEDECIILGEHPRSYDSRYFGPVKKALCRKAVPVLIWG